MPLVLDQGDTIKGKVSREVGAGCWMLVANRHEVQRMQAVFRSSVLCQKGSGQGQRQRVCEKAGEPASRLCGSAPSSFLVPPACNPTHTPRRTWRSCACSC